jgi:D-arabinose 1-dehydrogenase-like Zn-dependent alcohol dehydrogenase
MSSSTQTRIAPAGRRSGIDDATTDLAWVAKAPKQPMVLEPVDLGPLGPEDVEVAVEHCGLCHSDLSVLNSEWGISQFPAILGHEVSGRVTAVGPNAKGIRVGQLVGVGLSAFSLILQQRGLSGSPVAIATMLDFAARHNVAPQTEHFPMSRINEAFARLESGKARYRIVLDADSTLDHSRA